MFTDNYLELHLVVFQPNSICLWAVFFSFFDEGVMLGMSANIKKVYQSQV